MQLGFRNAIGDAAAPGTAAATSTTIGSAQFLDFLNSSYILNSKQESEQSQSLVQRHKRQIGHSPQTQQQSHFQSQLQSQPQQPSPYSSNCSSHQNYSNNIQTIQHSNNTSTFQYQNNCRDSSLSRTRTITASPSPVLSHVHLNQKSFDFSSHKQRALQQPSKISPYSNNCSTAITNIINNTPTSTALSRRQKPQRKQRLSLSSAIPQFYDNQVLNTNQSNRSNKNNLLHSSLSNSFKELTPSSLHKSTADVATHQNLIQQPPMTTTTTMSANNSQFRFEMFNLSLPTVDDDLNHSKPIIFTTTTASPLNIFPLSTSSQIHSRQNSRVTGTTSLQREDYLQQNSRKNGTGKAFISSQQTSTSKSRQQRISRSSCGNRSVHHTEGSSSMASKQPFAQCHPISTTNKQTQIDQRLFQSKQAHIISASSNTSSTNIRCRPHSSLSTHHATTAASKHPSKHELKPNNSLINTIPFSQTTGSATTAPKKRRNSNLKLKKSKASIQSTCTQQQQQQQQSETEQPSNQNIQQSTTQHSHSRAIKTYSLSPARRHSANIIAQTQLVCKEAQQIAQFRSLEACTISSCSGNNTAIDLMTNTAHINRINSGNYTTNKLKTSEGVAAAANVPTSQSQSSQIPKDRTAINLSLSKAKLQNYLINLHSTTTAATTICCNSATSGGSRSTECVDSIRDQLQLQSQQHQQFSFLQDITNIKRGSIVGIPTSSIVSHASSTISSRSSHTQNNMNISANNKTKPVKIKTMIKASKQAAQMHVLEGNNWVSETRSRTEGTERIVLQSKYEQSQQHPKINGQSFEINSSTTMSSVNGIRGESINERNFNHHHQQHSSQHKNNKQHYHHHTTPTQRTKSKKKNSILKDVLLPPPKLTLQLQMPMPSWSNKHNTERFDTTSNQNRSCNSNTGHVVNMDTSIRKSVTFEDMVYPTITAMEDDDDSPYSSIAMTMTQTSQRNNNNNNNRNYDKQIGNSNKVIQTKHQQQQDELFDFRTVPFRKTSSIKMPGQFPLIDSQKGEISKPSKLTGVEAYTQDIVHLNEYKHYVQLNEAFVTNLKHPYFANPLSKCPSQQTYTQLDELEHNLSDSSKLPLSEQLNIESTNQIKSWKEELSRKMQDLIKSNVPK